MQNASLDTHIVVRMDGRDSNCIHMQNNMGRLVLEGRLIALVIIVVTVDIGYEEKSYVENEQCLVDTLARSMQKTVRARTYDIPCQKEECDGLIYAINATLISSTRDVARI